MTTPTTWFGRSPAWLLVALVLMFLLTVETVLSNDMGEVQAEIHPATSWLWRTTFFLAIAVSSLNVWYFFYFPRLLSKQDPAWPLDAWRQATYGVWLSLCIATLIFKGGLMRGLKSFLKGSLGFILDDTILDTLIPIFMELILIPLVALVGLVVIWNFRRVETSGT